MALTQDTNTPYRDSVEFDFPVAANVRIYAGALVALDANGYATPGATSATLQGVGIAQDAVDNTGGALGAEHVTIRRGCFLLANSSAADAISRADIGKPCYIVDDETVAKTNASNTRSPAGIIRDANGHGVWVEF
jgi:hypothetical protein